MTKPDDIPQDVWDAAKELLAVEYDRDNQYPSYAAMAREDRGAFTHCSIRAIARSIIADRERQANDEEALDVADALDEFADIDECEGGNPHVIATERRAAQLLRTLFKRGEPL